MNPIYRNPEELKIVDSAIKPEVMDSIIRDVVGSVLSDQSLPQTVENQLTRGGKSLMIATGELTFPPDTLGTYNVRFIEKTGDFDDTLVDWHSPKLFLYSLNATLNELPIKITLMGTKKNEPTDTVSSSE